jgi:tetratricopeptide (TPR) repeat protein
MGFVAIAHFQAGELAQSLVSHDEALALVDANPGVSVPPATLEMLYHYRGRVLLEMGRLEEARADLDRADGFGRELDSSRDLRAMLDMRLGNFGAALDRARTLATAAERFGSPFRRVQSRSWLGQALHLCGYAGEAVETLSSALALLTESSASRYYRAGILAQLADALVDAGEPARALERAQESVAEASATQPRFECLGRISLARALLATYGVNGSERAEQELERARVLVEETGARLWWPEILLVRAELARVRGDEASRVRELREVQRVLLAMGAKPRAEAITRELAA